MTMHSIEDMPHMFSPTSGEPLYAAWQLKAAYAAGMTRAAEILDSRETAAWKDYEATRSKHAKGEADGLVNAAVAIRAQITKEQA